MPNLSQLYKDLERFVDEKVEHYLENITQQALRRLHPSEEREFLSVLQNFIELIKKTDLRQATLPAELSEIANWKKEFTKKILLPNYLTNNPLIPLEEIPLHMKKFIIAAFTDKKIKLYIQMGKRKLMRALSTIEPQNRFLKAKQVVSSTVESLQKEDKDFPKKAFMDAFKPDEIKKFIEKIPLRQKGALSQEEELLLTYLKKKYSEMLHENIAKQPSLLMKLQILNNKIMNKEGKEVDEWIKEYSPLPTGITSQTPSILKALQEVALELKAETLLQACQKEIMEAKKKSTFEAFPKQREAILKKYHTSYLQEHNSQEKLVKEYFQKRFQEEEKKLRTDAYQEQIIASTPSQKPKKSKGWKKV